MLKIKLVIKEIKEDPNKCWNSQLNKNADFPKIDL